MLEAIYSAAGGGFMAKRDIFPSASFASFFGMGGKAQTEDEKFKESLGKLIEHANKNESGASFVTLELVYGSVGNASNAFNALNKQKSQEESSSDQPSAGK